MGFTVALEKAIELIITAIVINPNKYGDFGE